MTPVLPWVCMVLAVFGGTLGHANNAEQVLEKSQPEMCEMLNTTDSGPDLQEVKSLPTKSFSFFVKPESSFKKLVIKISVQNALFPSSDFYSDEDITLNTDHLIPSGGSQWTHVKVEHYKHKRPGLRKDRHAFKVSFGNITLLRMTHDSWLFKGFKGFTVFAEGGAKVLFNCAPNNVDETPVEDYVLYSMWLMAGLLTVATFLLGVLCLVYVYIKYPRKKKPAPVSPMKAPVYDEFDEEVLERLRQKVEALRRGKSVADPDTVVVTYPPRQENFYVLEETGYGGVYGNGPNDHHYEEIGEKYKPVSPTDSLYQNPADEDSGRNVSTVDNIYESLSCFENYLEKRGDEARISFR